MSRPTLKLYKFNSNAERVAHFATQDAARGIAFEVSYYLAFHRWPRDTYSGSQFPRIKPTLDQVLRSIKTK